jgi:hypothetical protein
MADAVTVQIYDGARNVVVKLTNFSDGTGEAAVKKIDHTTLVPDPLATLKLKRCDAVVNGGTVTLLWEGTPNKTMLLIASGGDNALHMRPRHRGVINDALTPTGNVLLTTNGFAAGSAYDIELEFTKGVQSI